MSQMTELAVHIRLGSNAMMTTIRASHVPRIVGIGFPRIPHADSGRPHDVSTGLSHTPDMSRSVRFAPDSEDSGIRASVRILRICDLTESDMNGRSERDNGFSRAPIHNCAMNSAKTMPR